MVAAGSILVLQIATTTTLSQGTSDIASAVAAILNGQAMSVLNQQITTPDLLNQLGIAALSSFSQPFQDVLTVEVQSDFAGQNDPLSIVENAFYQVVGSYPTAGSTTSITPPGGSAQATGEPGLGSGSTALGSSASGVPIVNGQGITATLTNAVNSIIGEGNWLIVALVGLVILILVLAAYSPNTKAIARAVTV